jgi:hypothetical protein
MRFWALDLGEKVAKSARKNPIGQKIILAERWVIYFFSAYLISRRIEMQGRLACIFMPSPVHLVINFPGRNYTESPEG